MNTACVHCKLDENGNAHCCLPVCECDISHLHVQDDPHAAIGYNPYNKPYAVNYKKLHRTRAK